MCCVNHRSGGERSVPAPSLGCPLDGMFAQGPLARLDCGAIKLGAAAAPAARGSGQQGGPAPWLPVSIQGVRLRLATKVQTSASKSRRKKKPKPPNSGGGAGSSLVRSAAAWPVSLLLRLAGKVLPRIPVNVEDVGIELEAQGINLHLQNAAVTFAAEKGHQLQLTLLAQHFSLRPAGSSGDGMASAAGEEGGASAADGAGAAAAEGGGWPAKHQGPGVRCPAVQVTCAVGPNK